MNPVKRVGMYALTALMTALPAAACTSTNGGGGVPPSGLEVAIDGPQTLIYPDAVGMYRAQVDETGATFAWDAPGANVVDPTGSSTDIAFPSLGEYVVTLEASSGSGGGVDTLDVLVRTPQLGDVTRAEAESLASDYATTKSWLDGVDVTNLFLDGSIAPIRSSNDASDPALGNESYDTWFFETFAKHMVEERGMPASALQSYLDRFGRDGRIGYDQFVAITINNRNVEDAKDAGLVDENVFLDAWDVGFISDRVFEDGWNPPYGENPGAAYWGFYNQGDRFDRDGAISWMTNVGFPECPAVEVGKDFVSQDFLVSAQYTAQIGRPPMMHQFYLTKVIVDMVTEEPAFEVDGEERFQHGFFFEPAWSADTTAGGTHWPNTGHLEPPVDSSHPMYSVGDVIAPFTDDEPEGHATLDGYLENPTEIAMVSRGRNNFQIDWNYSVTLDDPNGLGIERTVAWPVLSRDPDSSDWKMVDPIDPTLPPDERLMFVAGDLRLPVLQLDGVTTWDIGAFNPCNFGSYTPVDAPTTFKMVTGSNELVDD